MSKSSQVLARGLGTSAPSEATLSVIGMTLLLVALGFHAFFIVSAYDGVLRDNLVGRYLVASKPLQWELTQALRPSRGLQPSAVVALLDEAQQEILRGAGHADAAPGTSPPEGVHISLALTNGRIMFTTATATADQPRPGSLPDGILHAADDDFEGEAPPQQGVRYLKKDEAYYIVLPILNDQQRAFLFAVVALDQAFLSSVTRPYIVRTAKHAVLVVANALGVILLASFFFRSSVRELFSTNRSTAGLMILVAVVIQALIAATAFGDLNRATSEISRDKVASGVHMLRGHMLAAMQTTRSLSRFDESDLRLPDMIEAIPELEALIITDSHGIVTHAIARTVLLPPQPTGIGTRLTGEIRNSLGADVYEFSQKLQTRQHAPIVLTAKVTQASWLDLVMDFTLDSLAGTLISVLIFGELLILLFRYREKHVEQVGRKRLHYTDVRPAIFMFVFAIDLSMSFIPLYMEQLYEPMFSLPREVVLSLPISVEFLFVGLFILVAGAWLDRKGWKRPFILGVLVTLVGSLYSWLATDAVHFILSRGVVGIGYGLTLMASQGFVIAQTDDQTKARGLSSLFAGLYAGSICGGATGAMLAERFGYGTVLMLAAVLLAGVALYSARLLRFGAPTAERRAITMADIAARAGPGSLWRFLSNRHVLALILLSSMPASIAVVGFLNYFAPLYLHGVGASQSMIGEILIIYGVCLIFVGPIVGRRVDLLGNKRMWIFAGSLLGSLAFLAFSLLDGILAAAVAVLLLGLSGSFVLSTQSAMTLKLRVARELGQGKALSIFRSTGRIGQVLGPLTFAWLITGTTVQEAAVYLGLAYLVMAVLFLVITINYEKAKLVLQEA